MAEKREADRGLRQDASWFRRALARAYPDAACTLDYETPLDLYVATVLSAQCTDARVNQVTPELFASCRGPEDYLRLGREELERRIRSTGFFRNKAKSILGAAARLVSAYGGKIPATMEDLLTLPGVGRKTANVILGSAFGMQEGIAVDTHVGRIARRFGLTRQTDPEKVERELMALFPRGGWTALSHRMILHGRNVCTARAPRCGECVVSARCAYFSPRGKRD